MNKKRVQDKYLKVNGQDQSEKYLDLKIISYRINNIKKMSNYLK
jgi:hypothetical protein